MRLTPDPTLGGWQLEDPQGRTLARGMDAETGDVLAAILEDGPGASEDELEEARADAGDDGYSDALYELAHDLGVPHIYTPGWRGLSRDERRKILVDAIRNL